MNTKQLEKLLAQQALRQTMMPQNTQQTDSFRDLSASELYCPNCKRSMPVREKLLLNLPKGDLYDYVCSRCGTSLGTRNT